MPNKLSQFWQELKRRKVTRTITVYAAAAFVVLELVDIVAPNLGLPTWTFNFVLILLLVGFVITVIFSWIYDIHPEGGIVKTEPAHKVKPKDIPKPSNSWKIASYISFVVIVGLIVLNIFGGRSSVRVDESLAKSIAVLPFHNYSGDPGQDLMCEGLTDEIISHLFKVKSFDEVRSLTSVLPYKDSEKSTPEIAEALRVNYILEGSYKRIGEELTITAQLIEPKSDNHIWLQDYVLPYNEVMGVPGEIALQIADHLKAFMSEGEQQSIDRMPTSNLEAYEIGKQLLYLYRRLFSGENTVNQVIELANKAIELDPNYAEAYAYLGFETLLRAAFMGDREILSVVWDAERYLKKAVEIDPYNLRAISGLVWLNYWVRWDYIGMEEFKEKYPNALNSDLNIVSGYVMNELQMGNFEKVLSLLERDSITEYSIKANILLGNLERARVQMNRASAVYSEPVWPLYSGEYFIWLQEFDSALYYLESAEESGNTTMLLPRFQADLAVAFFKTGNMDLARSTVGRLIEKSDTTSIGSPAYFTGWYYSWIGEPDSAFYWLEKAVDNRSFEIPWLKVDPAFNSLKEDPRYQDLYERIGFKAYDDYMASKNK